MRRITLLIAVLLLSGCVDEVPRDVSVIEAEIPPVALADPDCVLDIKMAKSATRGDFIPVLATITNVGLAPVSLVHPGDGSECGWRTPMIKWSILPIDSEEPHPQNPPIRPIGRCGNINTLKEGEVFRLEPGDSRVIEEWIHLPTYGIEAGEFRIAMIYENNPTMDWKGLPLGEHDAEEWKKVQSSTSLRVVSNEVPIQILPAPAPADASDDEP